MQETERDTKMSEARSIRDSLSNKHGQYFQSWIIRSVMVSMLLETTSKTGLLLPGVTANITRTVPYAGLKRQPRV